VRSAIYIVETDGMK
jgi:hypothetical protein